MSYDYDERPSYNTPLSPRAPMWLTPEERAAGIHKDLKIAARRFLCPNCQGPEDRCQEIPLPQLRTRVQPLPVQGRRLQGLPPGQPELSVREMPLLRLRVPHQRVHRPRQQGGPGPHVRLRGQGLQQVAGLLREQQEMILPVPVAHRPGRHLFWMQSI